jgi:hypothetical protein
MGTDKSCLPYCNFLLNEMTHNSHAFVQKNGSSGGGGWRIRLGGMLQLNGRGDGR